MQNSSGNFCRLLFAQSWLRYLWGALLIATISSSPSLLAAEEGEVVKSPDSVDVGPGFGPRWLSINSLGFAYPVYDVLDTYPYNRLVVTKVRWDGAPGMRNELTNIPIGNSKTENSIHFIYDSKLRQLGYAISNSADRYGSAHGLQVGVINLISNKPRIYLESANYRNDGYNQLAGVSMSLDGLGFAVSYKGSLYFMEFGDDGSRVAAEVKGSFRDSYLPNFDDSSIEPRVLRKGHNTQYPIYYSDENILVYEKDALSMYNLRTKKLKQVVTTGKGVQGVTLSSNRKTIGVLKDNRLVLYDIAGNKLQSIDIEIPNARNIALSPDGQYVAFDNLDHVFVKQLVFVDNPDLDNEPPAIIEMPKKVVEQKQSDPFENTPEGRLKELEAIEQADKLVSTPSFITKRPKKKSTKRPKRKPGTGLASLPEIIKNDPTEKCTSMAKILNLRKRLVAETNALSGSVDPTKLVGLRRIAANLRQMANCQSFAGSETGK